MGSIVESRIVGTLLGRVNMATEVSVMAHYAGEATTAAAGQLGGYHRGLITKYVTGPLEAALHGAETIDYPGLGKLPTAEAVNEAQMFAGDLRDAYMVGGIVP